MDTERFEKILKKSESSSLDFKSEQYSLIGDKSGEKTAEFVKDIISFTNTIRDDSAYIIIGIEELKDSSKKLLGLNENIDDAIFQQKIKDKVNPKPIFSYSTFEYNGIRFGIFEIPINYYSEPIIPIRNLKGLEIGKVYFRRGTSNSEATVSEIIRINDWFRTLNANISETEVTSELSKILVRLNDTDNKLAPIAADILNIAKKLNNKVISDFFNFEIIGWNPENVKSFPKDFFEYRKEKVIYSSVVINSITSSISNPARKVYQDLKSRNDSDEMDTFFNQPIAFIDSEIVKMKQNGIDKLYSEKRNLNDLLQDKNSMGELMVYYLFDTYFNLSQKIRYKYISELMKLIK